MKGEHKVLLQSRKNGLPYLQFENLMAHNEIRHGIFTRRGGISNPPYESLNVGFSVGDSGERVVENRNRIAECLGGTDMIFIHQVHGTHVFRMSEKSPDPPGFPPQADAIVSNLPGKNLVVQVADCQAVLLFDPVKLVVANIHSGWRGSIADIAGRTVGVMQDEFGATPIDIMAGIGPSLGPCCGEFKNYRKEIPKKFWGYKDQSVNFDFWAITCDQLADAGLRKENIETSGICTKCNTESFFSYRGQNETGRFAAVIGLR